MNTLDIEDRLRRTYADVAEHTIAVPPSDVTIIPLEGRVKPARRWSMVAAAAAVATLVIGAAVVINRSGPSAPAGIDPATLVHVLPGTLPSVDGDGIAFGPPDVPPLRRIETTAERDVLEYATDDLAFTIEVRRGSAVQAAGAPNTALADGSPATLTEGSDTSLVWQRGPSLQVVLRLTGADPATILDLANGLVFVTEETWRAATEHGGFGIDGERTMLASFRIDGEFPLEVDLTGDLHSGARVESGFSGFRLPVDRCVVTLQHEIDDEEGTAPTPFVVIAPGHVTDVIVTVEGEPDRTVELTSLAPAVPMSFASFELDQPRSDAPWPEARCGEVSP